MVNAFSYYLKSQDDVVTYGLWDVAHSATTATVNLSIICLLVGPKINVKSNGDPDIQKNKIRGMHLFLYYHHSICTFKNDKESVFRSYKCHVYLYVSTVHIFLMSSLISNISRYVIHYV